MFTYFILSYLDELWFSFYFFALMVSSYSVHVFTKEVGKRLLVFCLLGVPTITLHIKLQFALTEREI